MYLEYHQHPPSLKNYIYSTPLHPITEQVIRFLHIQLFDCFLNKAVSVTVSLLKGGHLQHICAKWFAKKQK